MRKEKSVWKFFDYGRSHFSVSEESFLQLTLQVWAWISLSETDRLPEDVPSVTDFFAQKDEAISLTSITSALKKQSELDERLEAFAFDFSAPGKGMSLAEMVDLVRQVQTLKASASLEEVLTTYYDKSSAEDAPEPSELAELLLKLSQTEAKGAPLYLPFNNSSLLVLKALLMNTQPFIECSSPEALTRIQLISLILDKPLKAHISQPLFDPAFKTSRFQLQTFENTLAIPRFAVKMSNKELATLRDPSQDVFKRFSHGDYNLRNEAPMLLHIQAQTTGRALVVIPMGMLFRSNDQQLRKEWLQKGQLEAVVKLPGSLFRTTNIATVLLIFNFKNTQPQPVYFLDAAQEPFTEKQKRKQSLTNLDKLIEHIAHRKEVPHQAKNVTVESLAQHNYELEPSLYILSQEEENMQEIMSAQDFTSLTESVEVLRSRSFTDSDTSETTYKEVRINTLPEAGFIPLTVSTEQLRTLNDSDSQTAQKQLLQAYDILLATRGRVGPVGIFPEGATHDWIAHQAFAVLRAKSQDHALALYLFLKSDIGQQQLHSLSAGSVTEQLPTKRLDELKVPQFTEAQLAKSKALFAQEVALLEKTQQITQEMAQLRSSFLNQIAEGN